ncbi:MAG TPA: DUF3352 domain-containing protein [Ktedonobacterales bacterium]
METGQPSAASGICPGCGHSMNEHAVYCPNCGRPNQAQPNLAATPAPDMTQESTYATAAQATDTTVPPPMPAWFDQPTTTGGIASLAAGPALTPDRPVRSNKRRNILTAISALVVVVLIASGAYWAYASFAARSDNQLAQYFPSTTVAFASADLLAASSNNFHINPTDLMNDQAVAFQKASGLDWQKDILPWVGRDIAVGVFPLASAQQGNTNPATSVGVVALIQSRDDGAARSAIDKLNSHLKQQGTSTEQSSYKGFTLFAAGSGSASGIYGSGSGWVIAASNAEAAHTVIDRLNGTSDSLNGQQAFKDATSSLPSGHFGTYYLNMRQLLNTVVPVRAPNGLASVSVPFIETYPVASGYVAWNNTGERSQFTFNAVRNPNIPDVSGDTTSLASLVPSDAVAYSGVANLGKLVQAGLTQVGVAASSVDPLKSALGISASDPLAQQPAAIAAVKTSSGGVQPVVYIHVSNNDSATQLINNLAAAHNWTTKPTTIGGQLATALYDSAPSGPAAATPTPSSNAVAVAFTVNNTLVIVPDSNTATLVTQVAQNGLANLTSNATFQKMVKAAPSGAAVTGYVSTDALQSIAHTNTATPAGMFSHLDALALTLVWNDSMLQGTMDAALHP